MPKKRNNYFSELHTEVRLIMEWRLKERVHKKDKEQILLFVKKYLNNKDFESDTDMMEEFIKTTGGRYTEKGPTKPRHVRKNIKSIDKKTLNRYYKTVAIILNKINSEEDYFLINREKRYAKVVETLSSTGVNVSGLEEKDVLKKFIDLFSAVKRKSTSTDFYNSVKWKSLRAKVFSIHGNRCQCCGRGPKDGIFLHVDHIKPRSKYPELELDINNLQILCEDCNIIYR